VIEIDRSFIVFVMKDFSSQPYQQRALARVNLAVVFRGNCDTAWRVVRLILGLVLLRGLAVVLDRRGTTPLYSEL